MKTTQSVAARRNVLSSMYTVPSGTVGPEAMTSSGSPTTSERMSVATCAG